jgi:hypothetical protein
VMCKDCLEAFIGLRVHVAARIDGSAQDDWALLSTHCCTFALVVLGLKLTPPY